MAGKSYYQYGTSPRKEDYGYTTKKKQAVERQKSKKTNLQKKQQVKINPKQKVPTKVVVGIVLAFAVLFAIGYGDSKINEKFVAVQDLKAELALLQKETEQLEVTMENNLNLTNLEEMAKEQLGMQKLTNKQKVYINLSKEDFVENTVEKVKIEENTIFDKIVQILKNLW